MSTGLHIKYGKNVYTMKVPNTLFKVSKWSHTLLTYTNDKRHSQDIIVLVLIDRRIYTDITIFS